MSSGLCCLTCRRYILADPNTDGFYCRCRAPLPTWDLQSAARDARALAAVEAVLSVRNAPDPTS